MAHSLIRHTVTLTCLIFMSAVGCTNNQLDKVLSSTVQNSLGGNSGFQNPNGYKAYPLMWEGKISGSSSWSSYLLNLIYTQAPDMMAGSNDITAFCSNYGGLSGYEKANFWGYLLSVMAYYESGFNLTSRYVETTMGIDPVTGSQVVSEGLLQLSYQDSTSYSSCYFNWVVDSKLAITDPAKTIFDPYTNLQCGVHILNYQIKKKAMIELNSGVYWAVIDGDSTSNHLPAIKAATQSLPFCGN